MRKNIIFRVLIAVLLVVTILLLWLNKSNTHPADLPVTEVSNKAPDWSHSAIWYTIEKPSKNIPANQEAVIFDFFNQIEEKIDFLSQLGINALVLDVFDTHETATANHSQVLELKHWLHITHNLSSELNRNKEKDINLIQNEMLNDPNTWEFTSTDKKFIQVLKKAKAQDFKVILNLPWNASNKQSKLGKDPISSKPFNALNNDSKRLMLALLYRWLDPNADGNPSDGVDGFSIEISEYLPHDIWLEIKQFVKTVNPNAFLLVSLPQSSPTAHVNYKTQSNTDAQSVINGELFDALLDQSWFHKSYRFFSATSKTTQISDFTQSLKARQKLLNDNNWQGSVLSNKRAYGLSIGESLTNLNAEQIQTNKLYLAYLFTYLDAPMLLEPKHSSISELKQGKLNEYYTFMIKLRRANSVLVNGEIEFTEINNRKKLLAYKRFNDKGEQVFVAFNLGQQDQQLIIPSAVVNTTSWQVWQSTNGEDILPTIPSEQIRIPARSASIIVTQ